MLQFSIATISVFVTILIECTKKVGVTLQINVNKYLPILSMIFGLILGIVGYFIPTVEMGENIIEAIFIGLSAGSAATGVNQIGKQLQKDE